MIVKQFFLVLFSQDFKDDVDKHEPLYNGVYDASEPLFNKCKELGVENGVEEIQNNIGELDERWNRLNGFVDKRKERINEIGRKLEDCQKELQPIEELITAAKKTIQEPLLFGDDVDKGKELHDKLQVTSNTYCIISDKRPISNSPSPPRNKPVFLLEDAVGAPLKGC